jgi:hypothetical protein
VLFKTESDNYDNKYFFTSDNKFLIASGTVDTEIFYLPNKSRIRDSAIESLRFARVAENNMLFGQNPYYKKVHNIASNDTFLQYINFASPGFRGKSIEDYNALFNAFKALPMEPLKNTLAGMYGLIVNVNTVQRYEWFVQKYPSAPQATDALQRMYDLVLKENAVARYDWFAQKYPSAPQAVDALQRMYDLILKENAVARYGWFVKRYAAAPQKKDALNRIYAFVCEQNNVPGYAWFIKEFLSEPQAVDALRRMYAEAFRLAKKQNTVEAYNDFIIAYPLAQEVKEATALAYALEKKAFAKGFFTSGESQARALLIKSKLISRKSGEVSAEMRPGYLLIVKRMNELLENEFPSEEATLRHLESEEFKVFSREIREALASMDNKLGTINSSLASQSALA